MRRLHNMNCLIGDKIYMEILKIYESDSRIIQTQFWS